MDFKVPKQVVQKNIQLNSYFDGKCVFCKSKNVIIRSSYHRTIPEMGNQVEKVIARVKMATIYCQDCHATFVPHHPLYPPKMEYAYTILNYVLTRFHFNNDSGEIIARDLSRLHQVDVPVATIYSWLKKYSPEFLKNQIDTSSPEDWSHIKTVTVDGTYVNTGSAVIGKKKDVESFSVTKLENGGYLLMWWE